MNRNDHEGVIMEEAVTVMKEAIELMKKIASVDDLRKNEDKILSSVEDSIRLTVEALKSITELSAEDIQGKMMQNRQFQIQQQQLKEELEKEKSRISEIPGAREYVDNLAVDMEKRTEPYVNEIMTLMGKLMGAVMGAMGDVTGDE